MNARRQGLLHLLNVTAAIAATVVARVGLDAAVAKNVALGALVTTASIGLIGVLVVRATSAESDKAKGGAAFGLVLQFFAVGLVIWGLKPEILPFGSGVIAVLGATVVAGIIDGLRQQSEDDKLS